MHDDHKLEQVALGRLQRLGGVSLLREMLQLFLKHAPERIRAAREASLEGDFGKVEQAVHSLKSSAGNVGARSIQSLAESIERMAVGAEVEGIAPLVLDLQMAWERLEPLVRKTIEGLDQ